jgi:P27 family predicted phage terminase small subunit
LKKPTPIKPPAHLSPSSKKWFSNVLDDFDLEESDVKLLTLASESWDRATLARETIAREGLTYTDRLGNIRKHPAVSIAEAATIAFARLVRELAISDSEPPSESRPPNIRNNTGKVF